MGRSQRSKPPRPGLPLLLPCALGLWAVAAATYLGLREAGSDLLVAAVATSAAIGVAGGLALLVLCWREAPMAALLAVSLAVGLALGSACGCSGVLKMQAATERALQAQGEWECRLTSDAKSGDFSITASAQATAEDGSPADVRLEFDPDEGFRVEDLTCGTLLRATLSLSAPTAKNAEYLWNQGICATAKVRRAEVMPLAGPRGAVTSVRDAAIGLIEDHGGDQSAIMAALVCGYRIPLEESGAYDDYKTVGLAHVVAVSGAHLAIVTTVFGAALRLVRLPQKLTLAVMALFCVAYVVFAGVPISAVRAAFMVLLMLAGQAAARRSASLNALALCIIAFIALDAPCAVSVSFFLSCGSTLGIVLFARLFSFWFAFLPEKLQGPVGDPLGLTLASNVATLPYSAALFSQIPLIAPVANVLATPLFSFGCVFGLAAVIGGSIVPVAAPLLLAAASWALWPLAIVTRALAAVPFACVAASLPAVPMIALSAVVCAALWIAWPALKPRALLAIGASLGVLGALALFVVPLFRGPSIVMLNVGQGDSFLVRDGSHALLIDTGNQDAMLREALGRNGVFALDAVLITHGDDDHCGSLDQLAAVAKVDRALLAADALTCACAACADLRASAADAVGEGNVTGLSVGDVIEVGRFRLQVLWPQAFSDEGGNADSLCLLATLDADGDGTTDWRAFFCGDAESEQVQALVDSGKLGDVDVLKVGHHGSRVSLTTELACALDPEVALIGVGANNRYGHPTEEVLECLADAGAEVFRSDECGDAVVSFTADRMSVQPQVQ